MRPTSARGSAISQSENIVGLPGRAAVSLLFERGQRPDVFAIRQLAAEQPGFAISHDPSASHLQERDGAAAGWAELLAGGLTFDLRGLAPAAPAPVPERRHNYGLDLAASHQDWEAITLFPGPHLAGGERMIPVLRTLASVAAHLTALSGVKAVAWHGARAWSSRKHFSESVMRWIGGGAFPGLGLTALAMREDVIETEGLALFTGQELRIAADLAGGGAEGAKLGLRLLHLMIERGTIREGERIVTPDGTFLRLEPAENGSIVAVWREET